ncbi:hypothetical protein D3C73_1313040 [compost metagenome]
MTSSVIIDSWGSVTKVINIVATPFINADKDMHVFPRSGCRLPAYIGASAPTVDAATIIILSTIILFGNFLKSIDVMLSFTGIAIEFLTYFIPDLEKL